MTDTVTTYDPARGARVYLHTAEIRCQLCGYSGPTMMGADARRTINGATFVDWSGPCPECDTAHALMTREH
jgi:hypothetical protein